MEFLSRCVIRIGTTDYPLSVSNIDIKLVPRLCGAPSFVEDISGVRRTNWQTSQYYLDGSIDWPEHGDGWSEYVTFINALMAWNLDSTDDITLVLKSTYDDAFALPDIIPIIDDNIISLSLVDNFRMRPAALKFKEANPRTSLPTWFTS